MNHLRPDERAMEVEIEKENRLRKNVGKGVSVVAGLGGVGLGAGLTSKILPFINEYITPELAVKGIKKVSPKLGQFLEKGRDMGLDVKEGLNFIKDKMTKKEEPTQDNRNIIEQYSPELKQFIEGQLQQGRSPLEAGALAQNLGKFNQIIKKLTQDHKAPWSSILESIYGGAGKAQPQQAQPQQQGQQGQQQGNDANAQLMAMMQKFQQAIKR